MKNKQISILIVSFLLVVLTSCHPALLPPSTAATQYPQMSVSSEQRLEHALALSESAKYQEALKEFSDAIDNNPNLAKAYYERSKLYSILGDWHNVLVDSSRALDIDPKYYEAYYVQSIAYIQQKDYQSAVKIYNRAMGYEPPKKELNDLRKMASLVVPAGEILLLDVECSVSSGKDCRGNFVPYNNTLKLHIFFNPDKSDIEVKAINISPPIGNKLQVISPVKYFNIMALEYLVTCISSDIPPTAINCTIDYGARNGQVTKKSNTVSSTEINEDSNPLICPDN